MFISLFIIKFECVFGIDRFCSEKSLLFIFLLMRHLYHQILLLIFGCLLILQKVYANHTDFSFYPISLEHGLSQTTIRAIMVDDQGILWLGTDRGLNSFKQNTLTNYNYHPNDSTSLPDNRINTLVEDSLKQTWVGTQNGLAIYNRRHAHFHRIYPKGVYAGMATANVVYFGGDNELIKFVNGQKEPFIYPVYPQSSGTPENYRIQSIVQLDSKHLLLGTKEKGVFLYNEENHQSKPFIQQDLHLLKSICLTSNDQIYIGTQGSGLFQYDREGILVKHYSRKNKGLASDFILDLLEYQGELWVCTDGAGIRRLDLHTGHFSKLIHQPGNRLTIPSNSVTKLIESNHQLWAGSVRKGAFCIKKSYIKTFGESAMENSHGLTESSVISMYEEENGLLWIGTDGGGINLFDPQTELFKHFPSTYGDKIYSLTQLNKDELLVSVYTKGLFSFNKKTGQYHPFLIVDKETNFKECFYGYLPTAHRVAADKIYILGVHPWIYTPSTQEFKEMKMVNKVRVYMKELMLAHSNSDFSLMTYQNQVYMIDQLTDQMSLLFELDKRAHVVSLAYDEAHTIWVASSEGLGYFDLFSRTYVKVPSTFFDSITFLLFDGDDRLWVGAQNKLFSYLIKDDKFNLVNLSDGFKTNEILCAYHTTPQRQYTYLGGTDGLVQIDNNMPEEKPARPKIQLEEVTLDGKSVYDQVHETGHLEINHDYNSLLIGLQITNEDVFQENLIRYTVRKNDVLQNYETYRNRTQMPANLSRGNYEVEVSCYTKSGDLTPPVKLFDMVILPPWYDSSPFRLSMLALILLVILGLTTSYYQRKSGKIRKNMFAYKQQVNEDKINFLINVNHELRTPLTLIYAPLKRLIEQGESVCKPEAYSQLQLIYRQAGRMYNIINMVLDLNRVESGYSQMKMGQHSLNQWIKCTTDEFENEAREKDITINYHFDQNINTVWFDEWKCQIVLSNLLMNAIKFSQEETTITVSTLLTPNNRIRISVSDEGIGVPEEEIAHVFDRHYEGQHLKNGSGIGLAYSKILANLHGGDMGVYNNKDKGATFYIELPKIEENDSMEIESADSTEMKVPEITERNLDLMEFSVLVVEDTKDLRNYLHDAFSEKFGKVFTAADGVEALEICQKEDPDLVVSDVMMPRMSGFELCTNIKKDERISHIAVVLLTARAKADDEHLGYKLGADFYVKKPFDMEFLLTVLQNILYKRKQLVKQQFATQLPSPQEITYSQADEDFLCRLNKIINENLSNEELNIALITSEMGMSRASLYNKMSKITGMGVNDYINRIRIEKAADLLLHTHLSIKEISQEVGFSYPRYFSTSFKQVKGVTPTQFKEQH